MTTAIGFTASGSTFQSRTQLSFLAKRRRTAARSCQQSTTAAAHGQMIQEARDRSLEMKTYTLRAVVMLGVVVTVVLPKVGEPQQKPQELSVRLGKLPDLRIPPAEAITGAEAKRIKELIASLASLEKPDFGLSATLSGDSFAPIPGQRRAGALLLARSEERRVGKECR